MPIKNDIGATIAAGVMMFLFGSCELPNETRRSNPHDPRNEDFVPNAPSSITVTSSEGVAIITWIDSSDFEDGYLIEKAVGDSANFVDLVVLAPNSTSFRDSSGYFLPNTYYRVSAFNESKGRMRRFQTNSIELDLGRMIRAYSFIDTIGGFPRIKVVWSVESDFHTGFDIDIFVNGQPAGFKPGSFGRTSSEFVDTSTTVGLGTTRTYTIRMFRYWQSEKVIIDSLQTSLFIGSLFFISNVDIEVINEQKLRIAWSGVGWSVDGFDIERRTFRYPNETVDRLARVSATAREFFDEFSTTTGDEYRYTVKVFHVIGGVKVYAGGAGRNLYYMIPDPVIRFPADQGPTPRIDWSHNTPWATQYVVERRDPLSSFQVVANLPPEVKNYDDVTADSTKEYRYRVRSVSSSYSKEVRVAFVRSYVLQRTITGAFGEVRGVAFNSDATLLGTGGSDMARLWDVNSGVLVRSFRGHSSVGPVDIDPTNRYLVTASDAFRPSQPAMVYVWDIATGDSVFKRSFLYGAAAAFSPVDSIVGAVDGYGNINLWRIPSGAFMRSMPGNSDVTARPHSISFSANGTLVSTDGNPREVYVYEVGSGSLWITLQAIPYPFPTMISPNATHIVVGAGLYSFYLTNIQTGTRILENATGYPYDFSADGTTLLAGHRLYNVSSGSVVGIVEEEPNPMSVDGNSDLSVIATGNNGNIKIYIEQGLRRWREIVDR